MLHVTDGLFLVRAKAWPSTNSRTNENKQTNEKRTTKETNYANGGISDGNLHWAKPNQRRRRRQTTAAAIATMQ